MTPMAQEAFLRAFHAEHPAVTSAPLGDGRAADHRSSYEVLCDRVAGGRRVVELGCGDGLLLELLARAGGREVAGVDLSPESLALARRRPALAGATMLECRAQRLPFADRSFDACVSHMAFMLMADIDEVAAEVARVLAPGGVLACALGGWAPGGETYGLFLDLIRPVIDAAAAAQRVPMLGDRRTRHREGLDEILRPAGFAPVDWKAVVIDLSGPAERVWATLCGGVYDLAPLDPATVDSLRRTFFAEARAITPPNGRTHCAMNINIATARLR